MDEDKEKEQPTEEIEGEDEEYDGGTAPAGAEEPGGGQTTGPGK